MKEKLALFLCAMLACALMSFSPSYAAPPECIPGDKPIVSHIHVHLLFHVVHPASSQDKETHYTLILPPNIGIAHECIKEIHTHNADGFLHIETVDPPKTFTLKDLMEFIDQVLATPPRNKDGSPGRIQLFDGILGILVKDPSQVTLTDGLHIAVFLIGDSAKSPEK